MVLLGKQSISQELGVPQRLNNIFKLRENLRESFQPPDFKSKLTCSRHCNERKYCAFLVRPTKVLCIFTFVSRRVLRRQDRDHSRRRSN